MLISSLLVIKKAKHYRTAFKIFVTKLYKTFKNGLLFLQKDKLFLI